jgi:hypothetical protein
MVVEQRATGHGPVSVGRACQVPGTDLAAGSPDQNEWLSYLSDKFPTVGKLYVALDYQGPPELVTMHLCLLGDDAITALDPGWCEQNAKLLRKGCLEYKALHAMTPHPASLMQHMRK